MPRNSLSRFARVFTVHILLIICLSPLVVKASYITNLAPIGSIGDSAIGIHGNTVIGGYFIAGRNGPLGYAYDIETGISKTLDVPGSITTEPTAIYGNRIVGDTTLNDCYCGFLYDGNVYTKIQFPGPYETHVTSVSTDRIAGVTFIGDPSTGLKTIGFVYDGKEYKVIDFPGARRTVVTGVTDSKVIGYYDCNSCNGEKGFVYDGTSYSTLPPLPQSGHGRTYGIDGEIVVGYQDYYGSYLYNGSSFTSLNDYGIPIAVDGNHVAGIPANALGYLLDLDSNTYTILDVPGGNGTRPYDLYGADVVGFYFAGPQSNSGSFLFRGATVIPEPSTIGFLILAFLIFFLVKYRQLLPKHA